MANYTEEFKQKVRSVYGNQFDEMLSNGNAFLGRYLDDSSNGIGVSIDDILLATDLSKLQDKVRKHKIKKELYSEYWNQPGVK